ncbi:hypothetical protein ACFO5Q_07140, partial [Kordiimonas lipolytica]
PYVTSNEIKILSYAIAFFGPISPDGEQRCYTKMMQGVHEAVTDKDYMFGTKLATLLGLE